MNIPYTVTAQIVVKKDQKRVESKSNPLIGGSNNDERINITTFQGEKLSLISTIYREK